LSHKQKLEQQKSKSAERKRSAAIAKRKRESSLSPSWWLTPVRTTTACARCGGLLRAGRDMVYRRVPLEILCVCCAEGDSTVTFKPSKRWTDKRRRAA
jgi:hypothetical protein